mgnify:CR=1 FL=1
MARTALDALNDQDIKQRNHMQAKMDNKQFDGFWTPERVQESIDSYQFNIDYYNEFKKKQRKNKALLDEISATIILQTYLYQ